MKPSDAGQLESLFHDDLWRCSWIPSESQRSLLHAVIRAELARRAAPASVPAELVDDLAQFIRKIDGNHTMGAGALAEQIADWYAAYGREQAQWIPVIERLPKDGADVLSWCGWAVTAVYSGGHFRTEDGTNAVHMVTHWMPLPEPPTGADK